MVHCLMIFIMNGPKIPIRLSGVAFVNNNSKIRLTRNINPYGDLINSKIVLMEVESINSIISELKKREFYYNNDNEPICYIKKKIIINSF